MPARGHPSPDPRELLDAGLAALQLELAAAQRDRLLRYLDLLGRWNRAYNLTAVREPAEMVTRHLLDSLAVLPWLGEGCVLDAGSGAGLPGIPLAIARPGQPFVLLDPAAKKVRFLRQAVAGLGLGHVSVLRGRCQDYEPPEPFPVIVARALASPGGLVARCGALLAPGGRLLAMAGRRPQRLALPPPWRVVEVAALHVPGLAAERHLVVLARGDPPRP